MEDITAIELKTRLVNGEKILILDVREPYEYDECRIEGSKLVPLGELRDQIDDLKSWSDVEVVVHCRSGNRSAAAKAFMLQNGFKGVRSLIGGIDAFRGLDTGL